MSAKNSRWKNLDFSDLYGTFKGLFWGIPITAVTLGAFYYTFNKPYRIESSDINKDGPPDIVLFNANGNAFTYYLKSGSAYVESPKDLPSSEKEIIETSLDSLEAIVKAEL